MSSQQQSELSSRPKVTLGVRIRQIRRAKGLTQNEFGKLFSISGVAISRWESDQDKPSPRSLLLLAELTTDLELKELLLKEAGLRPIKAEIHTETGIKPVMAGIRIEAADVQESRLPEPVRHIPLLRDPVAAGTPRATNEKEIEQILTLPRSWFPRGGELYALRISGDSMSPILNDGYVVIIDTAQRDPARVINRMVAAREDEGITIKWLRSQDEVMMLVPQHVSLRHPVRVLRAEGNFSIVGVVVKWIGEPPPPRR